MDFPQYHFSVVLAVSVATWATTKIDKKVIPKFHLPPETV